MLEGLAAWVLNTYVGEYVENLNTDQLSIGLLSGAVELENLPLRKDALKNLDLPIEVKAGFIGKIALQIPVRHIKSEPCVISIDSLYLVAGPAGKASYDEEKENQAKRERNKNQLEALESQWKAKFEKAQPESSSSWYAYSTSLFYNILENIQLKIRDVHIRYEDTTTVPNESFAFGITIKTLSAQSTDESWKARIVQGEEGAMRFKLLQLESFAIYWDTDIQLYGDMDINDLRDALQKREVSVDAPKAQHHDYLVQPVSAEAKLRRNGSLLPLRSRSTPRFICDVNLQKIPLSLSEEQYHGTIALAREFERSGWARLYRKWRPNVPVQAQEWWDFAVTSTLHGIRERNKRISPQFISQRIQNNTRYIEAYTKILEGLTPDKESKECMDEMENDLEFDELRLLRELTYRQLEKRIAAGEEFFKKPDQESSQQEGLMQRWVWGWGGWYSGGTASTDQSDAGGSATTTGSGTATRSVSPPPIDEQELMDVIGDPMADSTLLKRDHVFALLNLNLQGGSFKLCSTTAPMMPDPDPLSSKRRAISMVPIIELEFAGVKMSLESRLRTSSMLFKAKLGSLYVRDVMTRGSLFPVLVSPQQRKDEISSTQSRQTFGILAKTSSSYMAQSAAYQRQSSEETLFEMSYESNPPNSNADCRLEIITRPLDMVYNPTAMQRISDFFDTSVSKSKGLPSRPSELQLTRMARLRYEELKNQTKQELRQTLDTLLEGEQQSQVSRWDIHLDISAPQIIIPDSFHSKDATLVVLDFGHLQLASETAKGNYAKTNKVEDTSLADDGDLGDDFLTPLSTPPNGSNVDGPSGSVQMTEAMSVDDQRSDLQSIDFGSAVTETTMRERMYDRYNLNMSDLQVLVGKATDNWRIAHTKGSSHMQVIEKFTISVKVERRLMFTTDPQWPSAMVSGNLPSLAIHINEQKIQALSICMRLLTGPGEGASSPVSAGTTLTYDPTGLNRTHTTSLSEMEATFTQRTQALLEESKLLEMQFSVDQLSLSVESRGRCIAECQVYGVKANLGKQPYNTSISLTVHGLLLIDALQQFGPEFELLLASHRDLSMHVPSGSIVDSDHSTPRSVQSPTSPQSPASPTERMMDTSSQSVLASAISAMGDSTSGTSLTGTSSYVQLQEQLYAESMRHTVTDTEGEEAAEALIMVEIELISAECPSNTNGSREALQIASVQFNNLDVIANQETIVELLSFFHRAFPKDAKESSAEKETHGDTSTFELESISSAKTEVTADFHRLNVVLVRGETDQQKHVIGRKVATATVTAAHVWATLGGDFHLEGSLGGLQLLDVTPEGSRHKTVFSVGQDPQAGVESSTSTIVPPKPTENELYRTAVERTSIGGDDDMGDFKAFAFTLKKMEGRALMTPLDAGYQTPGFSFSDKDSQAADGFELTLHLASLVYTHVPRFLHDITLCVDEFQSSATVLADSIQKAAAGVAMDFVRQKSDMVAAVASPMLYSTKIETPVRGTNRSTLDAADGSMLEEKSSKNFNFKMTMETPIIIIPRSAISSEVLVAHLGKISITNTAVVGDNTTGHGSFTETDGAILPATTKLFLGMRDIKVVSFNHLDSKSRASSFVSTDSRDSSTSTSSMYKGTPILHDTSLELTINLIPMDPALMPSNYSLDTMGSDDSSLLLEEPSPTTLVSGRIISPLKVILSKHVYEQILQTMDNLTYKESKEAESKRTSSTVNTPTAGGLFMWTVDPPENNPHTDTPLATPDESSTENSENETKESHTKIKVDFHLPEFSVEMCGNTCDGDQGLVNLTFQNFSVEFENTTPYTSSIDVTLHSLVMEDLLQPPFSKHRYLMVSTGGPRVVKPTPKMYHSNSCPSISTLMSPISVRPGSLPSALDSPTLPNYSYHSPRYGHPGAKGVPLVPSTPPPSLSESLEDIPESEGTGRSFVGKNALMRIKVMLVDRECPEFVTKYKKVNRFVDVTFNSLDTTVNLQTWVVLLDFLGIGGPAPKSRASPEEKALLRMRRKVAAVVASSRADAEVVSSTVVSEFKDEVNTEMVIQVGSLSLLLNKPDYELAKANVSDVSAHLVLIDGNIDVGGHLGSMSLLDLTPHGKLYRERFTTKGQEALSFRMFKYGQPDLNLDRDFDLSIKLRMSSVRYVHTTRFQMETVAFAQHFNQLQEVLGTMRAASDGIQVKEDPKRSSRISLDIEAGSPVCIAPISSKSKDVLVVNLGNLTLKNEFLFAGSWGTIAKLPSKVATDDVHFNKDSTCLLDCMHLDLVDMDLFSAERVEHIDFDARDDTAMIFPSFVISRKGGRLLNDTCRLRLQVDRNLDADISRAVPDFSVSGMLSSVHCSLDVAQYQLIRGMLDHNLGEKLEEFEAMQRTQNPVNQTILSGHVWTSISLNVQLVNVTLELLLSHQHGDIPERSLGKFDFIRSCFSFESFSDTTKTIDLVSHAIRASDTRWKQTGASAKTPTNVFWEVLTPSRHHSRNPNPLQLELHYASQLDHTRATVLLNNMRVMCVMDLLLAAMDFLLDYDAKSVQAESNATPKAPTTSSNGSSNQSSAPSSTTATRDKRSGTPVNVASGIFTKRAQATEKSDNPLEIRLNVTETEFVVMEDTASSDSSAVILKATCAVMTYKPENKENPLSCSLEELEAFSCCLSNEGETALSIVDPVTVNAELKANPTSMASQGRMGGLLDVMDVHRTLEVHIQTLNIRVSYHDARLFLAIMNSLPAQMLQAEDEKEDTPKKTPDARSISKSKQVSKLQELGFSREDCKVALTKSSGQLNQAATWLLENAKPVQKVLVPSHKQDKDEEGALEIAGVEIRAGSVSICLIDDCKDCDVPLIEVMLQNFHVFQKMLPNRQGTASGTLLGDYYNRSLSGWEPFIEPWKLNVEWLQQYETMDYPEKIFVQCKVNDRLDLNLTSALMDLYSNTKKNWTEDYYKTGTKEGLPARHRSPFVPFALRNLTGCRLWFSMLTTNPNRVASSPTEKLASPLASTGGASSWIEVASGEEVPFVFEEKGKQRHRNTHELRVHQLLVRVEGWERMAPVSVDKVGTFFRLAKPEHMHMTSIFTSQRVERVLFHVTLEGSARKLVTIHSALTVVSRMSVPLDVKLINPDSPTDAPVTLPLLSPNATLPVPLSHTEWLMYMRPHGWGMGFCETPVRWQSVYLPKAMDTQPMKCQLGSRDEEGIFRFWAYIRHEAFPHEPHAKRSPSFSELSRKQDSDVQELQPGHTVTLLPPVVLTNLLPFDLKYKMHRTGAVGNIQPGKDEPIYDTDLNQSNDISFTMDNFPDCHTPLSLPPRLTKDAYGYILLRDSHPKKRRLFLKARVECRAGRCLKILISAPYWLLNKSGLPLIFKQDGADFEAAGQFEVHEQARSVAPLVFSYTDSDKAEMCVMRLGRGVIGLKDVPHYCQRISLEGGSGVRSLRVFQQGGRPHMVYHIGIDIRPGRGRYHDTQIVTFVPRFQLQNRSSCKLAFAQRHLVEGMVASQKPWNQYILHGQVFTGKPSFVVDSQLGHKNPSEHLAVMPGSSVIFHWPRDDLDKLLCARIVSDETCRWSGGMRIDQPSSYNINMRSSNNQSNIMHVGVGLVGATFFVVFSDAIHMPPPYRIDNLSELNIIYYQSKVADTSLRTVLRPKASVPYTWDELVLPKELYCEVKGGSGATHKLDTLGEGKTLYYENFIYVCLTHTCSGSSSPSLSSGLLRRRDDYTSANLVFDIVPNGKGVILRRKEPGKRSQLWRMTSSGMLQNQAFTPPRDPNKAPSNVHDSLVLDIADLAANPNSFMPLVMRKPDERRKGTQTWFFKQDGRMVCHLGGLAAQAKGGTMGMREGCEVVLGPADIQFKDRIPVEQAIHTQKHLPGSGSLKCQVIADGPTRVLQITDSWIQPPSQLVVAETGCVQKDDWIYVKEGKENEASAESRPVVITQDTQGDTPKIKELDVIFFLRDGLGLSLVNSGPEEVLYTLLSGLEVHYVSTMQEVTLKVQIKNIQVDNQLTGAQKPVVLFVTPSQEDKPSSSSTPALSMVATKLRSSHEMVDIYKMFFVNLRKMTLNLEELLLLKLMQFAGFAQSDSEIEKMDESYYNSLRPVSMEQEAKRIFFETLKLNATEFKLSVLTTSKLPSDLKAIKTQQRLFMIQFEDAPVSLDPFTRLHPFETQEFLLDAAIKHYTEELKSQAVKILGSVDFLGNPIGLIQDLRDGLKELILEGNVTGMVKNVTHGMSNTAAKVTGSISNTLGTVIMDNHHEEIRSNIRGSHDGSSSGHLKAGVRGFTFGVVGGLTSIFTQTYQGMTEDGVEGLMKGLGKGVIGTVAKPVAGVMDLASGTMAALRSSTSSDSHLVPNRVRLTRCCVNPAGMLPRYSAYNARGQEYMQKLCESSNGKERFFSMETLRSSPTEGMQALITSEWTYFLPISDPLSPVLQVMHSELFHARHTQYGGKHYIELTKMANTEAGVLASRYDSKERPKVGCDNERLARKVSQQINYAKGCYEELKQQVLMDTTESNLKLELVEVNES